MAQAPLKRVFVAGASGAVGRRLCRLLVDDGWHVTGTTRSPEKVAALRALGVAPVVVDVFDAPHLQRLVVESRPMVVVHQLTDLPPALDPRQMDDARIRTTRLRDLGTRNLIAAAVAAQVERLVAQSIAFAYAPGPLPYDETAPLDVAARGVASLEHQVLHAPLAGVILRYGKFYGPGTGFDTLAPDGPVHIDAAADAARRALTHGTTGIYNIAEADGTVTSRRAMAELGWSPDFRLGA